MDSSSIKSVNEQRFHKAGCAIESSWKNFFIREEKRVDWVSFKSKQNGCSANVSGSRVKEEDF